MPASCVLRPQIGAEIQRLFMEPGVGADPADVAAMRPSSAITSSLLSSLVIDRFPNLKPLLDFFAGAFDQRAAERDGCIIPKDVRLVHLCDSSLCLSLRLDTRRIGCSCRC